MYENGEGMGVLTEQGVCNSGRRGGGVSGSRKAPDAAEYESKGDACTAGSCDRRNIAYGKKAGIL